MVCRFQPAKTKRRPRGNFFHCGADVPGGSSTGACLSKGSAQAVGQVPRRTARQSMPLATPVPFASPLSRFPYYSSFWREIRSSAFASQYRLCSTSLFAPPSRRKQLQVDGGLRRDIEQCLTASFVPRSARCRVHCRLLRALLLRAYCQPALVACSRCAAVGRASRRLAVGNARFLPHFLQNALLVASISLYKLTS